MFTDIAVGEVLWISRDQWPLAHRPRGYPLQVTALRSEPVNGTQYVVGDVLTEGGQVVGTGLLLALPVDQPRAITRGRAPAYAGEPRPNRLRPYLIGNPNPSVVFADPTAEDLRSADTGPGRLYHSQV